MLSLKDQIIERLINDSYDYGVDCLFVVVENFGVKLYRKAKVRDYAYEHQEKAFNHGIGPEVYEKVEVEIKNYTFYGYKTQLAELYNDSKYRCEKDIYLLKNDMRSLNFPRSMINDVGEYNSGYINGKIVCIDFCPGNEFTSGLDDFELEDLRVELQLEYQNA